MRSGLRTLTLAMVLLGWPGSGQAQAPAGEPTPQAADQDALGADDTDPLALGDTASLALVPLEPTHALTQPPAPLAGEIVGASTAVREVEHRTHVRWEALEAHVEERWRFRNTGSFPAELRYRQALPEGARLEGFSVCIESQCREATLTGTQAEEAYGAARARPASPDAAPIGLLTLVDDARGHAAIVRAAAIPSDGELTVHLAWSVDAPLHGGLMQLALPIRGTDPRAAPALITAEANGLEAPTVEGGPGDRPAQVEPWFAVKIEARSPAAGETASTASWRRCGDGRCLALRAWAPPERAAARDVVLALDVSPSTNWARTSAALTSVLTHAPRGSRFLLVAFAARAQALSSAWQGPDEVPLTALSAARDAGLGPATRFDQAVRVALPYLHAVHARAPQLILISDGRLMGAEATTRAFDALSALSVPVSLLDVGDEGPSSTLEGQIADSGGRVIQAGLRAERASRGRQDSGLDERVSGLFARRLGWLRGHVGDGDVAAALYAGDSVSLDLRGRGVVDASFRGRALRVHASHDPEHMIGTQMLAAVGEDGGAEVLNLPVALAPPEPAPPPASPALGRGVPAETVLTLLHTRLIPPARACFRQDRAGREDYAVRAEFRFRLQDREVVEAGITGELPDSLRRCLLNTLFTLEVPSFRGAVVVTYPLRTVPVGPAMTLELLPEVARDVDGVLGPAPTTSEVETSP